MGFFGFGRKSASPKPPAGGEWIGVAAHLAGALWTLLNTHPEMLTSPYARAVLRHDWGVGIASDKRDPKQILGKGDVSFVFLREDQAAFATWVEGIKSGSPMFQQIETEQFAKALVRKLMQTVNVVD
jgi:hypothetical protein